MDWMTFHLPIMLGFLLVFAQAGRAAAAPPGQRPDPTLERIIALVETQFMSNEHLEQVQWDELKAHARTAISSTRDAAQRQEVLRGLLASLRVSHTDYIPRDDPRFWDLASIFERVF